MRYSKLPSGNLQICIDSPEEKEMLQELLDKSTHKDHGFLADILEETGWAPNGQLYQVAPESIGALTDSPILSDEVELKDDGTQNVTGKVWWFPNYQVESFAETLIRDGRVIFDKAPV